ncbi:MAG: hypothetical protein ACTSXA_11935 [Candidatus Heimdallarchaeota archaeon]
MIKKGIKTYKVLVVIVIITCATFSGIYLTANGSKTMNLKQQATTKILQSGNLVSLDDNNKLIVTRNELHQSSTYLLSNDEFSLDMRIRIANLIAKMSGNDLSVLYLIAIEIAKAFNAEIKPFHQGYLVYSGNDWAVLIEHGYHLVALDDSARLINQLSKEYSNVFLGSCKSNIYSQFYNNVNGFKENIQVEDVIKCLVEYFSYKTTIHNLLSSELKNYELTLTVDLETFTPTGAAKEALDDLVESNAMMTTNPIFNIFVSDYLHIDIKPGSQLPPGTALGGNWGKAHIDAKSQTQTGLINNNAIRDIMTGQDTRCFVFFNPFLLIWQAVMYKFDASFTSVKLLALLIGLPARQQLPGWYDMYTIRSVEARNFEPRYPTVKDLVIFIERDKWSDRDRIKKRFGYPTPVAIPQAAEALAAIAVSTLLGQDGSDGYGSSFLELQLMMFIFSMRSLLITALAVRVCFELAIILAAMSAIAIPVLTLAAIVAVLTGVFIPYMPKAQPITDPSYSYQLSSVMTDPDEGSWSDYDEYSSVMEDAIETESASIYYDDDNDGLSNAFELNYYELYIEDYFGSEFAFIPDCPITDDFTEEDKYTWLDPNSDMDFDGLLTITEAIYDSDPFVADTDSDGLPDNEELEVLATLQDQEVYLMDSDRDGELDSQIVTIQEVNYKSNPSAFDSDQDGLGDKQEKLRNTFPLNPDTDGDTLLDGWEVYTYAIKWEGGPDEDYTGYYEDLVDPLNLPDDPTWCESDIDGDGLTNTEESRIFSNPYKADTDSDGLSDYLEYTNNLDPTNPGDAEHDHDKDGISTLAELTTYETNFLNNDTDEDGWTDEFEVNTAGTNPNLNDTDADGILDGDEYNYWISIGVTTANAYDYCNDDDIDDDYLIDGLELAYGCDPLVRDTDSDGLWDGTEILVHNTLPLVADTDADGLTDWQEIYQYFTNPNDDDHDNDGWKDGYEVGTTGTNPKKADTDSDGIKDKVEFNYWKSRGKSNATAYAYCKNDDIDNDGLEDGDELLNGADPLDNDSDNDGILDGLEVNNYHTDPDDPDSDNDGYDDLYEIINGTDPNDASDYPGAGGGGFGF